MSTPTSATLTTATLPPTHASSHARTHTPSHLPSLPRGNPAAAAATASVTWAPSSDHLGKRTDSYSSSVGGHGGGFRGGHGGAPRLSRPSYAASCAAAPETTGLQQDADGAGEAGDVWVARTQELAKLGACMHVRMPRSFVHFCLCCAFFLVCTRTVPCL